MIIVTQKITNIPPNACKHKPLAPQSCETGLLRTRLKIFLQRNLSQSDCHTADVRLVSSDKSLDDWIATRNLTRF